jgi:hypothetical protein
MVRTTINGRSIFSTSREEELKMKRYYFNKFRSAVLFVASLILALPQLGFCNGFEGGPPAGYNFFGPAIVGKLTITPDPNQKMNYCYDSDPSTACSLIIVFNEASCRGTSFPELDGSNFYTTHNFNELVSDNFEGFLFNQALFSFMPEKCWPNSESSKSPVPYDNVINSVTKFENANGIINANVVIMFIVNEKQ